MKKILSIILMSCLCLALTSCGAATLTGDPAVFQNANNSFSIELPADKEDSWVIDEDTNGDILDMTDSKETVNVVVQCLSKTQIQHIATDLDSYKAYAVETVFADYLDEADLKDTDIDGPEFIINITAGTYSNDKTEGLLVCMESSKCFYAYMVMAVEGGYGANKKVLQESILSLKELTAIK